MKKGKIFISHSSKDIDFIDSFVKHILRLGLDIPADRIFCSSMEGHGIKSGEYIPDRLKTEMQLASIALLFISKNYKDSEVCLNEVGAAWVSLEKTNIMPILLPDVDFKDLGFIDLNRLGIKLSEKKDLIKLINDNKGELNPSFDLGLLHEQIDAFINETKADNSNVDSDNEVPKDVNEWNECFEKNLIPFDHIIRKAIPAHNDGIHKIEDQQTQTRILRGLSKADFLRTFWYKKAEGDYYVEQLKQTPNGNWLVSIFNWEIKISEMWVAKDTEMQYEFILIHSAQLPPFEVQSDVGGKEYNVGVLTDGTIVSENERLNGYAIIKGETVDLDKYGVEPRLRDRKAHWVFFGSYYHKIGFNPDETIEFCKKLDNKEVEVNSDNLFKFLHKLNNHPTIIRWR